MTIFVETVLTIGYVAVVIYQLCRWDPLSVAGPAIALGKAGTARQDPTLIEPFAVALIDSFWVTIISFLGILILALMPLCRHLPFTPRYRSAIVIALFFTSSGVLARVPNEVILGPHLPMFSLSVFALALPLAIVLLPEVIQFSYVDLTALIVCTALCSGIVTAVWSLRQPPASDVPVWFTLTAVMTVFLLALALILIRCLKTPDRKNFHLD